MKVYFGEALQDMLRELRAQAANNLRVHVLPEVEGDRLEMDVHITTLCNNQIYEAVLHSSTSLADVPDEKRPKHVRSTCERARKEVIEQLEGFEIRRGILRE